MFEHMTAAIDAGMQNISEFPYDVFPRMGTMLADQQKILALLKEIGFGEITFCHNDLNQKNLVWNPQTRKINFIDFEMTMNNYAALDIGQVRQIECYRLLNDF